MQIERNAEATKASMLGYHAWPIANLLLDNATRTEKRTELEIKHERKTIEI